jgi:hypothetical protein
MKKSLLKCFIVLPLILGCINANAAKSPEKSHTQLKSSQTIKNTESIEALTDQQVYELTHDAALYNLFMIDQTYNISDQYIDRIVASAKDMGDVDFMRTFSEMNLNAAQKKEFNQYISDQRKLNGFDLSAKVNLMVRMDNAFVINKMISNNIPVPEKPSNFKEFDLNDYFDVKYENYIRNIDQIMNIELTNGEKADLIKSSGILPKQSLINLVNNTAFKPKLRELIVQEIKERDLTDQDKAYIVFWSSLLSKSNPL